MQIKLHGKFADDYPGEFHIEADTVADAIEGWSRQVGFYTDRAYTDRPIVRVLGFKTQDSMYEKTEQKEIHLVPAMCGGGGKFGTIIIGAALIAASFIPGIGQAVQVALLSSGIGMTLTGVMGLFMKAPSLSKDKDPDASKYLGLNDNTTTIGTPIAICYGRVPVNGHVLALNVDSNDLVTGAFPASPT